MEIQVKMTVFLILLSLLITSCKGNNNNIDEPTGLITELPAVVTNIQKIVPHPHEEKYAIMKDFKLEIHDIESDTVLPTNLSVLVNSWKNDSVLYGQSLGIPSTLLEININTKEMTELITPYSEVSGKMLVHNRAPVYNMGNKTLCFNAVGQNNGLGFNGLVFIDENDSFTFKEVGLKPTWGGKNSPLVYFISYSPDGQEANYTLSTFNYLTKEEKNLFPLDLTTLRLSNIDVNQSGDKVLFCAEFGKDSWPQIYIYDLIENEMSKITDVSVSIGTAYFKEDSKIVFTSSNGSEYFSYSLDLNTKTVKPILNDI